MNIYENILRLSKEKGKPIAEIEKEAGLSNGSISKWENSSPIVHRLIAVAKVLDVPMEELIS